MVKKYRGDAMFAVHEAMEALRDVGAIDDQTMGHFDVACLTPTVEAEEDQVRCANERREAFAELP
jgi:putative transcriptional regulator